VVPMPEVNSSPRKLTAPPGLFETVSYNVGPAAYCGSTTAKRFSAGDWRGACRALNESDSGRPQWVTAGGRVLPGLVKWRAEERAICERDL
ncbi:glycoside hydrolase family protein, partial [Burkholderia sp. BDU5]|uniref:glycoside hydrolase family protein n=1 Tax=Burkholderia sp. BDU5 TaxID=1385590 RepID=UPI000AE2D769